MIVRTDEFNNNVNRVNLLTINSYYLVLIRYVILVPALSLNPSLWDFVGLGAYWDMDFGSEEKREPTQRLKCIYLYFLFDITN